MQRRVERELGESDAALLVLNGEQGVGPGDRFIADALPRDLPVVIAVNKVDRLDRPHIMVALKAAAELGIGDDIFPICARKGTGVEALSGHLLGLLPEGRSSSREDSTDLAPEVLLAELMREQVLRRTFQEVPHAVEVVVEDVETPRGPDGRPGPRVGRGGLAEGDPDRRAGKMIKAIGTAARESSSASSARACISSCRCACAAAGAATTACWTGSGSTTDRRRRAGGPDPATPPPDLQAICGTWPMASA